MKPIFWILRILCIVIPLSLAHAQIPRTLSYQGLLADSLGNPKPDGTYSFTFRLYESAMGGSPIWSEARTLSVTKGLFYTTLGDQVIIGPSVAFDRPYWLGIQVSGNPELSTRMPLTASAYSITSIRSDTARFALTAPHQGLVDSARIAGTIPDNTVTTAKIVDGAITGAKVGNGQVVKRLNGIADGVTLAAQGGATITSHNDTIIINAGSGGGGTGVQGVQNTNNTIDVINPNGPTVTVNVKNSGISTTQLADNSVTSAKIADGTIQFTDMGQNGAISGQTVKWSGTVWQPSNDNIGTGVFLPLTGGTLTGSITSTGSPSITMGKGNFGGGNTNAGTNAFVAGQNNTSSSYVASVAGGSNNSATLDNASIGGGIGNLASGISSHVGGGDGNTASGTTAAVGGGHGNAATGSDAVAGGGNYNQATGVASTVSGGAQNKARGLYSVVGGGGGASLGDSNSASGDYSTIGGGRRNVASGVTSTIGGGWKNSASEDGATVCGGIGNRALGYCSVVGGGGTMSAMVAPNLALGDQSTVAGGWVNTATGYYATVSGGMENVASGDAATVPGGRNAVARGYNSFAFGPCARANHNYSVVIKASSSFSDSVASCVINQMVLMAGNGFYLTNTAGVAPNEPDRLINTSSGGYLTVGGTWTNSSDKNLKENFTPIDKEGVLSKVIELPIAMWNYTSESNEAKHIGPTSQDFHALFGVGSDDKSISTVDPAGVALVAIQQLALENQKLRSEMEDLRNLVKSMASGKGKGGK
jgi:trimeric autotransporter adhesin